MNRKNAAKTKIYDEKDVSLWRLSRQEKVIMHESSAMAEETNNIEEKTAKDVFELRKQGLIEEAYDTIRPIYAKDKSPYTSLAMFWTAVDILRRRVVEGRTGEAQKILLSLRRMLSSVPDKEGWVHDAMNRCEALIEKENQHQASLEEGPRHLQTGAWGEGLAAAYLREKGYVILDRDWRSGHRDIDIIAKDGDCTVFVEVKTRHDSNITGPLDAINSDKLYQLGRAIIHYINYHHIDRWRFDVITIVGDMSCSMPEITHIENFNIMETPTHRWHKKRRK